jgi:hypothetical protein
VRTCRLPLALLAVGLALAVGGCRSCGEDRPSGSGSCAPLAPVAPWLVLQAVDQASGKLRLLPIDLGGAHPQPGALVELPALPVPRWAGHYRAVATHAGPLLLAVVPAEPGSDPRHELVQRRLDRPDETELHHGLGLVRPVALHLVDKDGLLVGATGLLGLIDLAAQVPELRPLEQRDGGALGSGRARKAYDLFAQRGAQLVAVQDEAPPFVADELEIECSGRVRPEQTWTLPGLENGSYTEVALDASELMLAAQYVAPGGSGHLLARVPLARLSDPELANLRLNAGMLGELPVVEELDAERGASDGEGPKLVAGARYTPWAGLGLLGDRVVLGAGSRGVLVLPRTFDADSRAELVDVGGACLDLVVRGHGIYVLAASEGHARVVVLQLEPGPGAVRLRDTVAIDGTWEQFVR